MPSAVSPLRARAGDWAPFAVAVAFAALAYLWLDQHGVALSRDSAHYLGVAVDLRFAGFELPAEPAYPIGYPLLVAQLMRFEPFAVDAARTLSWLSYGLLVVCAAALFRRVADPLPASLGVAVIATLPPIVAQQGYALSDAPFGALIQLHVLLIALHDGARGRARAGWLAAAAAALGLATIVRVIGYAGIVVFTGYVLWLAIGLRGRPRDLVGLLLPHSLCYLPPLAIALAYSVIGRPVHGYRGGSQEPFGLNVERAIEALALDLGLVLIVPALLGFGLFAWRVLRRDANAASELRPTVVVPVGYAFAMLVVYLGAVVVAATLTKVSPVGSRFFAPYYGVFLIVVLGAVGLAPGRARRAVSLVVSLALVAVVLSSAREIEAGHQALSRVAAGRPLHFEQGFAASSSARPLRDFLGERGRGDESTSLSVLAPLPRRGHHKEGARSLLFVRDASASPVESARFERLGPGRWRLRLGDAPEDAGLLYLGLPLDSETELSIERTLAAVVQVMVVSSRTSHWLLVPAQVDAIQHVTAIEGVPLRVAESRELGAYRGYRFELAR